MRRTRAVVAACALAACGRGTATPPLVLAPPPAGAEARALDGRALVPVSPSPAARETMTRQLAEAERAWRRDTTNADSLVWYGRRLAYLGRYRDAIAAFTLGTRLHPRDARFLRHRGHRLLTIRELAAAERDLAAAAALVRGTADAVEPDGQPNARGIPTSTLHFNVHYHLGLARYLQGDWRGALAAYADCMRVSTNDDAIVATAYWQAMTATRAGDTATARAALAKAAPIAGVIENDAYLRLLALWSGRATPESLVPASATSLDDATTAYGVATWLRTHGRAAEGEALLRRIVAGPQWASFGYLAAEADLVRAR